ncbi:MAG: AAA family ATPase, partial [Bacteroidales bacterium]|nr:AAA family ATPase [Bacteroidales bacterium]
MQPTQKNTIKILPYGMSDFARIRRENKYYVDKTMFIPKLEEYSYQMFLRPRRFGKSLMLNMLAAYYDVKNKDNFDELFGGLYIGDNPTEERNKYLILKFNFSGIDPDENKVQDSFDTYIKSEIVAFAQKYSDYLEADTSEVIKNCKNSNDAFTALKIAVSMSNLRIYVIIDEYDNFANTMLADSESNYMKLTHGDGFFRLFFNNLKAATTDNDAAVSRIMISGVTPLTLSDVTSGYNIGMNISADSQFNSLAGFTETEFRQMLEYYRDATGVFRHTIEELIEITKPWYDNNCFSEDSVDDDRMYNSDMALFFIREYIKKNGKIMDNMVD